MAAMVGHGPTAGTLKGAIDGGTIWWVAPNHPQIVSSGIWRDLMRATADCRTAISVVDKRIELPGGGSITVKSADHEDSLRGPGLDGVVMDEAAFIKPEVWTDVIRPALTDKRGWAIFPTTPNGKNWIHKLFLKAKEREGWEAWQCPSAENPLVSQKELDDVLYEVGPRRFSQEHLAQFTDIEGALFPAHYFDDHIHASYWPSTFELSVIALDASMGADTKHGDYSALAFMGLSGGLLWVEMDLERRPPMKIVEDTYLMAQRYNPQAVVVESNVFQGLFAPLFDQWCQNRSLTPLPLHMLPNVKDKKEIRIQRLDPYLANKEIRFKPCRGCDLTIEQLQMFPDKDWHDDGPDALEMAIRTLLQITDYSPDLDVEYARV